MSSLPASRQLALFDLENMPLDDGIANPRPSKKHPWHAEDRGYMTPCWIWRARYEPDGYARVHRNGRTQLAHRYVYETLIGPIAHGLELDHLCRQRGCVRPDHLEPVTHTENVRRRSMVRLSPAIVAAIRASNRSHVDLAAEYGVSVGAIAHARIGYTWADVPTPTVRTTLPIDYPPPNPSGRCLCGCGTPTPIARQSDRRDGIVGGHPVRFIKGHSRRLKGR